MTSSRRFESIAHIRSAIVAIDTRQFTGEDLAMIKRMYPTSDEIKKAQLFRGDIGSLTKPELFIWHVQESLLCTDLFADIQPGI